MRLIFICVLVCLPCIYSRAQLNKLQDLLDSLRTAGHFPGLSVAIARKDGSLLTYTSGYNDRHKKLPLETTDRFLQGSVGKTYASAIALRLVGQGRIKLDRKVVEYLGHHKWFHRVPNAADITVRMLMNHTSGIMRYEFKDQFLKDLNAEPNRVWRPEDLIRYVLDEKASFGAGGGWEYSDTNYILLGMIIEQVTGKSYYDILQAEILQQNQSLNTFPQDGRKLQNLAQGYAGAANEFGGKDEMIDGSGLFIINPQFEWTGGGVYSTTGDLAKWGKLL